MIENGWKHVSAVQTYGRKTSCFSHFVWRSECCCFVSRALLTPLPASQFSIVTVLFSHASRDRKDAADGKQICLMVSKLRLRNTDFLISNTTKQEITQISQAGSQSCAIPLIL